MEDKREKETHLKDYTRILYKYRWAAAGFLALTVIAATVRTFTTVPVYRATAQILIEKEKPNIVDFKELYAVDATTQDFYQTQYKILQSRFLAGRTLDKLYPGEEGSGGHAKIDGFLAHLLIEPVRNTRLVRVHYESTDPDFAARAANAVVSAYIEQNIESRLEVTYGASDFLSKKIDEQRKKLEESELALLNYKEQYNIISLKERENITVQKLAELNSDVLRAENTRVEAETRYRQGRSIRKNLDMIESIPTALTNPMIIKLKADEADLLKELSEMSEKYGGKHPRIMTINKKIKALRRKLSVEIKKVLNILKNEYEVALAKENTLKAALEKQKAEAQLLGKHAIAYEVLLRDVEANNQMYEILLTRLKETGITGGIQTTNVKVIDSAIVPKSPIRPKKARNIFLSLLFGLVGGFATTLFLDYLDNTVKDAEGIKKYVQAPYLGFIPDFKPDMQNKPGEQVLVSLNSPRSGAAEAYRGIRTAITFSSAERGKKTVLITSSAPAEGKTVTASNLAVTLAQAGSKTLLIDSDFRKPRLHRIFGIANETGFSNLLVGTASAAEVIRKTNVPYLDVITCGYVPPNPAELLGSGSMKKNIALLRERYDRVLFDSPPIVPITDAVVISTVVDEVVLVIQAGKTSRDLIMRAVEQMKDVRANLIGAVLNNVKMEHQDYYYYYYRYGEHKGKEKRKQQRKK